MPPFIAAKLEKVDGRIARVFFRIQAKTQNMAFDIILHKFYIDGCILMVTLIDLLHTMNYEFIIHYLHDCILDYITTS